MFLMFVKILIAFDQLINPHFLRLELLKKFNLVIIFSVLRGWILFEFKWFNLKVGIFEFLL